MSESSLAFTAGLLGAFIDLLRTLDAKGVLPRAEIQAEFAASLAAVPEAERGQPKHAVLRFLVDGLGHAPPAPPARPEWLRGVIDGAGQTKS
jgi:hypothetical protein